MTELRGVSAVEPGLVASILAEYRLEFAGIHGPAHWLRVRANGLALAARTPAADADLVELFALLHDCRREDEDRDHGHGERAAAHATRLAQQGVLRLEAARLDLLVAACAGHEHGGVSADPTIGCCWDADRLELSRLHRRPIRRLLSTPAARVAEVQAAAWQRGVTGHLPEDGVAAWGLTLGRRGGRSVLVR